MAIRNACAAIAASAEGKFCLAIVINDSRLLQENIDSTSDQESLRAQFRLNTTAVAAVHDSEESDELLLDSDEKINTRRGEKCTPRGAGDSTAQLFALGVLLFCLTPLVAPLVSGVAPDCLCSLRFRNRETRLKWPHRSYFSHGLPPIRKRISKIFNCD